MKTRIVLSFLLSFSFYLLSSQIPQGFNYQAVARDGTNPITTAINVRITIQSESGGGTTFWIEEHASVLPNSSGLFSLVIGNGVSQSGSSVDKFSDIDWANGTKYIKTEINKDGTGYVSMGTSQLLSVPYSMVSGNVNDTLNKLVVTADQDVDTTALFIVRNKDGQTIFAVYNAGVRIYVDNGTKGKKGGFAIGGFDKAKDGINQDLFIVDRDSVRVYLDTLSAKVKKGGFAIGGFGNAKKGSGEEYLHITRDSTRVYVNNGPEKVKKGGFAIGGFGGAKSEINNFLDLTPENYFIGHEAGSLNTTGLYNSFLGYNAGRSNTSGDQNIFIGRQTGASNISGSANLFIGDSAGYFNTSGQINVFLGAFSGWKNETGYQNINIGYTAGLNNISGNRNIHIGTAAGLSNTEGILNVSIGNFAGWKSTGNKNVYIGARSGLNDTTGSKNVFIGFEAGMNETSSEKLYISNTSTSSPLIYGDFAEGSETLVFNGNVGIGVPPECKLQVGSAGDGSEARANAWNLLSDAKLKTGFIKPEDPIQMLSGLNGYYFYWKNGSDKSRQFGFSAQEVEKVLPEIVSKGGDDYLSLDYGKIAPLIVEGMKEQQKQIESLRQENQQLKSELDELKALINSIVANQAIGNNK